MRWRFAVPVILALAVSVLAQGRWGGEIVTLREETYGRWEARMLFPQASGIDGSFYLWGTPFQKPDWNEIDIEIVGHRIDSIENAINCVWGEIVETMVRLQPVAGVPHKRPALKISGFSGANGSTSG